MYGMLQSWQFYKSLAAFPYQKSANNETEAFTRLLTAFGKFGLVKRVPAWRGAATCFKCQPLAPLASLALLPTVSTGGDETAWAHFECGEQKVCSISFSNGVRGPVFETTRCEINPMNLWNIPSEASGSNEDYWTTKEKTARINKCKPYARRRAGERYRLRQVMTLMSN